MAMKRTASLFSQGFKLPLIRGPELALDSLAGRVVLVVNAASH